jgi:hypothetical protein
VFAQIWHLSVQMAQKSCSRDGKTCGERRNSGAASLYSPE